MAKPRGYWGCKQVTLRNLEGALNYAELQLLRPLRHPYAKTVWELVQIRDLCLIVRELLQDLSSPRKRMPTIFARSTMWHLTDERRAEMNRRIILALADASIRLDQVVDQRDPEHWARLGVDVDRLQPYCTLKRAG